MTKLNFNKIYVIESLDDNEPKTGQFLYDDIISIRTRYLVNINSEFLTAESRSDILNIMSKIKNECLNNQIKPIIHFEIHGANDASGLVLKNNDYLSYKDLTTSLREINFICENNLFLTLAVCHGAWIMESASLDKPCPFVGIIGSFEAIQNGDLLIRYTEFYNEFLKEFNFIQSFEILKNANNKIPNSYKALDATDLFKEVYKKYISENTSDEGIKKRLEDIHNGVGGVKIPKFKSENEKKEFNAKFTREVKTTKQYYYKKHSEIFYMIDKFPENRERFSVPENYEDLPNE